MSTGWRWGKAFQMETRLSKGSEVKPCMQKVRISGRGALGNKIRSKLTKLGQSAKNPVPRGSNSVPWARGVSPAPWLLLISKEVAPSLCLSLPDYLKGLLEVTVLKRLKCSTETGYHDFTCAHTQTHMHTNTHMHTLKNQKDVASIPASALLPMDLSNAAIQCI